MSSEIPSLGKRLAPLLIFGYLVAAIRLGLDYWDPEAAMSFGLFYTMPVAIAYVGVRRMWGPIGWKQMAVTMVAVGFLVWGIANSITYTIGQFEGWTEGRYYPGVEFKNAEGVTEYREGPDGKGVRCAPPAADTLGKITNGLLHGLISSALSSVYCILIGSLFVAVYKRSPKSA